MITATIRPFNQPVTPTLFEEDGWFHKGMWYPRLLPTGIYPAEYTGYSAVGVDTWDFGFRVQYRSEITPRHFSFRIYELFGEEAKALHKQLEEAKGLKIHLVIRGCASNWIQSIIFPDGNELVHQKSKLSCGAL